MSEEETRTMVKFIKCGNKAVHTGRSYELRKVPESQGTKLINGVVIYLHDASHYAGALFPHSMHSTIVLVLFPLKQGYFSNYLLSKKYKG
jgi:hypothetical protein